MRILGSLFLCLAVNWPAVAAEGPSCKVTSGMQILDLATPVESMTNLTPVFQVLESLATSEKKAREIRRRLAANELRLAKLEDAGEASSPLANPAALFEYVKGVPTIFLRRSEIGLLAVLFFHEMVHATDDIYKARFPKLGALRRSLAERAKRLVIPSPEWLEWADESERVNASYKTMVFDAEKLAVNAQRQLLVEMFEKFPCAADYFKFHEEEEHLVVNGLSDDEIKLLYHVE